MLWMDIHIGQQSNLKSLTRKTYQELSHSTTKLARTGSAWGTESGALNRQSMLETLFGLALVLIYESKMDLN